MIKQKTAKAADAVTSAIIALVRSEAQSRSTPGSKEEQATRFQIEAAVTKSIKNLMESLGEDLLDQLREKTEVKANKDLSPGSGGLESLEGIPLTRRD